MELAKYLTPVRGLLDGVGQAWQLWQKIGDTIAEEAPEFLTCLMSLRRSDIFKLARANAFGCGQPVVTIQGLGAPSFVMSALRSFVRTLGFTSHGSPFSLNMYLPDEAVAYTEDWLKRVADKRGERVTVIAHSYAGILVSCVAVSNPGLLRAVIVLGTPFDLSGVAEPTMSAFNRLEQRRLKALRGDPLAYEERKRRLSETVRSTPLPYGVVWRSVGSVGDKIVHCDCAHHPFDEAPITLSKGGHWALPVTEDVFRIVFETLRSAYPVSDGSTAQGNVDNSDWPGAATV